MNHGHHAAVLHGSWDAALVIAALVLVAAGVAWLLYRRAVACDCLTPEEQEKLTDLEREILSMLRQHGGPIRQDRLIAALHGDNEGLAVFLLEMEKKGRIRREWEAGTGTYLVSEPPGGGAGA